MKKISGFLASMLLIFTTISSATVVYGRNLGDRTMYVYGGMWTTGATVVRDTNYSTMYMKLLAVYPIDGKNDNYEKAKFRVKSDSCNIILSDVYVVKEGDEQIIQLKEGHLSIADVEYQAKGNKDNLDAYVHFQYDKFSGD